jgi:hypothetical protein
MEHKKISLPEAIFITAIVLFSDIAEFIVDLTGFGIIIGIMINFIVGGGLQIYLFLKGVKGFWKLGTNIAGTLFDGFIAAFLPIKTITWIITLILVNKEEKIAEITGIAGKVM